MDSFIQILQTSLILNFKTGNILIDTLIAIISIYIIKLFFEKLPELIKYIGLFFDKKNRITSEYLIQGTVTISTECCIHFTNFPLEYKAIMYKINKLALDIKKGKHFNIMDKHYNENLKTSNFYSYSLNTENEIKLNEDVYIRQHNVIDKSNDLKSSIEFYNLYVYSYKLKFNELKKIIDNWIVEYNNFIKEYNDGYLYYFSYLGKVDTRSNDKINLPEIKFESHKFYSNKSFDNIFFDDKDSLIKRLDYFLNNEEEYRKLGIPYTLGFLFYGIPGCGKTSTIKAIANYTKRHIIEIQLSKIKTCGELKQIFFSDLISGHYIPSNKKIIILEDIDCMSDIIKKRESEHRIDKDNIDNFLGTVVKRENNECNVESNRLDLYHKLAKLTHRFDDDELTLSYILNLIDGVLEQPGRILIITTNYPEKLDSALLRPGRIDMKVYFGKCSRDNIAKILKLYFKTDINDKIKEEIPEGKYTPAEIFELCFNYNNLCQVLNKLIS